MMRLRKLQCKYTRMTQKQALDSSAEATSQCLAEVAQACLAGTEMPVFKRTAALT